MNGRTQKHQAFLDFTKIVSDKSRNHKITNALISYSHRITRGIDTDTFVSCVPFLMVGSLAH